MGITDQEYQQFGSEQTVSTRLQQHWAATGTIILLRLRHTRTAPVNGYLCELVKSMDFTFATLTVKPFTAQSILILKYG